MKDLYAKLFDARWQQGFWGDYAYFWHAKRGQRMDFAACHAAMQHIAHQRNTQIMQIWLLFSHREDVQQALRRVRVAAIARVNHANATWHMRRDKMRCAALRVAHYKHIGVHGD